MLLYVLSVLDNIEINRYSGVRTLINKEEGILLLKTVTRTGFGGLLVLSMNLLVGTSAGFAGQLSFPTEPVTTTLSEDLVTPEPAAVAVEEGSPQDPVLASTAPALLVTELPLLEEHAPNQSSVPSMLERFADLFTDQDPSEEDPFLETEEDEGESVPAVPIVRDHKVERHIQYFHTTIGDRFEEWLTRLGRYRPMVEGVLAEFDLPLELAYLSLVESGFNPRAYSRARATGPWQFMKATGRNYGLRVNYYVDERRDPIKSTVAAARYLRDLYDLFGQWPLAMAAYNAGEGHVKRALRKTKGDSFHVIAKSRYIRRETKEYVPRFMAATIIGENPHQFGLSPIEADLHEFDEVIVTRPLRLRDIAKAAGISLSELQGLNPELRRGVTPPKDKEYYLKVPVDTKAQVESVLKKVPTWKRSKAPRLKKGSKVPKGWYRVRWGDSLWKIAKRFRMSVRELKARNNIRGRLIRPGDLLRLR